MSQKSTQLCPCCKSLLEIEVRDEGIKVARESQKYEMPGRKKGDKEKDGRN